MIKNVIFAVLFFVYCIAPVHVGAADNSVPVSVRDLIVIGLQENIGFRVNQLNIPLAAESIIEEESTFDAELFAGADYSDSSTPIASSLSLLDYSETQSLTGQVGLRKKTFSGLLTAISLDSEWTDDNNSSETLSPRYRTALNINLTQPLLRNFGSMTNTTALRISQNQKSQTVLLHLGQAQSLALQIELLAVQLSGEAEIVALRSNAVTLAKELYLSNKRRFDVGVIPVSEVQETETALANRELEVSIANQSRDLYFENLNRLLNHSLSRELATANFFSFAPGLRAVDLPPFEQIFSAAQEKNVSLKSAEFDIHSAEIQKKYYGNQLKPQLDLNVQAGLNGLSGDERSKTSSSGFAGSWDESLSRAAEQGYQWGVGLQFSLPLGNRLAKSRARMASTQHKQANYRQQDLEVQLRSELQQQLINLNRAYEQFEIAERFEQLAKLTLHQEQRRVEEGLSDSFRLIITQNSMIDAQIGRVNALTQYYASIAQLNFTRGIILEQHNISLQNLTEENNLEPM